MPRMSQRAPRVRVFVCVWLAMALNRAVAAEPAPIRAPATEWNFRLVESYVELDPVPAYHHASPAAFEAFRDWKFGVRIHWGLYANDAKGQASTTFHYLTNKEKGRYQDLSRTWNPAGFNAQEWMGFFDRAGFRMMAVTTKHAEGFSLYDTKTRVHEYVNWAAPGGPRVEACDRAYSIMETPFHRDIVKELCDAARAHHIGIDLYFTHLDWFDADFRDFGRTPASRFGKATAAQRERAVTRHRAQLKEILTNYGKIDQVCLDGNMDKAAWPSLRQTLIEARKIQPDVMFRNRGIGNYGDYFTPQGYVPSVERNTNMPWMVIYPLGLSFSYKKNDHFKGAAWTIRTLIDTVAKGGNFMPGIGPDANGRFDAEAIRQLEEVGAWLKVNGSAIFATRPRDGELWEQGPDVRFTRSKDNKTVYALCLKWPGKTLNIDDLNPKATTRVTLLGAKDPLKWTPSGNGLTIELPDALQEEKARPCSHAWCFAITGLAQ
jgi:alpha-L-fucosidase